MCDTIRFISPSRALLDPRISMPMPRAISSPLKHPSRPSGTRHFLSKWRKGTALNTLILPLERSQSFLSLRRPSGSGGFTPAMGPGGDANPPNLVYPAGTIFVRCGWVAETLPAGSRLDEAVVGCGQDANALSFENPLADLEAINDVEAGRSLMPPLPHLTIDRILRRAAERIGVNKVGRYRSCRRSGLVVV